MDASWWVALMSGVVVAAACGLRAFLPLLLVGLAARVGLVELASGAEWLAGDHALLALGAATAVELAADKIPVVDHVLDAVGIAVRPTAAWVAGYALLHDWPAPWGQLVALGLAAAALGVQAVKAKLRLGTTTITFGHGNPVVSALEDVAAALATAAALLVPVVALVLLAVAVVALANWRRRSTAP